MFFGKLKTVATASVRNIHTTSVVRCRGVVGSNLPFPVHNKYLLLLIFTVVGASGTSLPFIALRRMIFLKNPPDSK